MRCDSSLLLISGYGAYKQSCRTGNKRMCGNTEDHRDIPFRKRITESSVHIIPDINIENSRKKASLLRWIEIEKGIVLVL